MGHGFPFNLILHLAHGCYNSIPFLQYLFLSLSIFLPHSLFGGRKRDLYSSNRRVHFTELSSVLKFVDKLFDQSNKRSNICLVNYILIHMFQNINISNNISRRPSVQLPNKKCLYFGTEVVQSRTCLDGLIGLPEFCTYIELIPYVII